MGLGVLIGVVDLLGEIFGSAKGTVTADVQNCTKYLHCM
jgi:hypothetical protein